MVLFYELNIPGPQDPPILYKSCSQGQSRQVKGNEQVPEKHWDPVMPPMEKALIHRCCKGTMPCLQPQRVPRQAGGAETLGGGDQLYLLSSRVALFL